MSKVPYEDSTLAVCVLKCSEQEVRKGRHPWVCAYEITAPVVSQKIMFWWEAEAQREEGTSPVSHGDEAPGLDQCAMAILLWPAG